MNLICGVLQALRWRVTRVKGSQMRKMVIEEYSMNDFLMVKPNLNLLVRLLTFDIQTKEFTLRLLNALSSDFYGRKYLLLNPKLIPLLIKVLKSEETDSLTRRNTLGTL